MSRQQSDSADNRPDATSQNGAETPATKAASEAKKHWLDYATAFLTLAAAGGAITAAVFTGWQATTADQGLRDSNRAYVHSTNFRFVHYGAKNENGRTQWLVSPLIENTGSTGTRGMLMNTMISSGGEADFKSLEKTAFSPALILPKSELTGAVVSMDGRGLDLLRSGGLITMGIIEYADIFGDRHLVEFCHRAQFGPIDWEGVPAGQPLRIRGVACETHNCKATSAVRIGVRVPPRSQAGGPREAMCVVRRERLRAPQHNADAHVTRCKLGLSGAKATYMIDAAPLR